MYKQQFLKGEISEKEYKQNLAQLIEVKAPYKQQLNDLKLPPDDVLRYIKSNYGKF